MHTSRAASCSKAYLVAIPLLPLLGFLFALTPRRANILLATEGLFFVPTVVALLLGLMLLPRDMSLFAYVMLWHGLETLGLVGVLLSIGAVALSSNKPVQVNEKH